MTLPRVLAILGSGEMAPTMTSVHANLLGRLPPDSLAVMLDTPYGFQENADEISARSVNYFSHNVGHAIEVLRFRQAATAAAIEYEHMCARVAVAAYVFAGPGSPSYALRQWRGTRVAQLLADKLRSGGMVVFASAAAVGLGEVALPVYEVYKVGEPPRWIAGLGVLAETGIRAAVIPHFNNAEGGTHDTRFCYMGERRLQLLEGMLPTGCAVLGVDEHTACIIDLESRTLTVRGAGGVTWRAGGRTRVWPAGESESLEALASVGGDTASPAAGGGASPLHTSPTEGLAVVQQLRAEAVAALQRRDLDAGMAAILEVESAVNGRAGAGAAALAADGPGDRAVLRELLMHLAGLARTGTADPRPRLEPLVEALLMVRGRARAERRFADADALRDALVAAGVEVRDTPNGVSWELRETPGD